MRPATDDTTKRDKKQIKQTKTIGKNLKSILQPLNNKVKMASTKSRQKSK